MTTTSYLESTATDVYRTFFTDTQPSIDVFAAGLSKEQAAELVNALATTDDPPTVHVLVSNRVLNWIRRDFHLASIAVELVESGILSIRIQEETPANSILTTDDAVFSLVTIDDQAAGLTTDDDEFVAEMRTEQNEAWEAADATDLRTPARSHVYETLAEKFGTDVKDGYETMLGAIGTTRKSRGRASDSDNLDKVELAILVGATHKLQLFELSKWGEDVGLASKATFSRTKSQLEDEGIIKTEKIPMDIGRPRQRLLLTDQFRDYEANELPSVVRDELKAAPA